MTRLLRHMSQSTQNLPDQTHSVYMKFHTQRIKNRATQMHIRQKLKTCENSQKPNLGLPCRRCYAIRRRFEQGQRELLINDADVEVNQAGAGYIHPNRLHLEPEKQLLRQNPRQGSDLTVAQSPRNVPLVMQ